MDFRQLRTFIEVARLQSFSKAAQKLFLTQPTVSSQILNLEEELGTKLFNRVGKNITLTKAGQLFFDKALEIINTYESLKYEIDQYNKSISGTLDISCSSVPRKHLLPNIISEFSALYKDVTYRIKELDSSKVIDNILDGFYDFGIVGNKYDLANLSFIPLMKDELVLISPISYNLNSTKLEIKDIINYSFIFREEGSGTRDIVEKAFELSSFNTSSLKIIAYLEDNETIKKLVECGLGLGFISKYEVDNNVGTTYRVHKIENLSFERFFYLVFNKTRTLSPLSYKFIDFLMERSSHN
ncbi:MAG: LysR family transcriptional regulator [Tissierellales bacterium]|nr:LysR family transcriptional regulator [Tissierellales bacterium]